MNSKEINVFIEMCAEVGDVWTPEAVTAVFGNCSFDEPSSYMIERAKSFGQIIKNVSGR